jgi:hypothetical protein
MSYDNSFLTFMNMIAGILAINVEYWKKVDSDVSVKLLWVKSKIKRKEYLLCDIM